MGSARVATTAEAVSARAVRRDSVQVAVRLALVQATVRLALVQAVALDLAVVRVARAQRYVSPRAIEAFQAAASARVATTRRARQPHAQRSSRRARQDTRRRLEAVVRRQEVVVLARADNF